jgi:hypothetical protein
VLSTELFVRNIDKCLGKMCNDSFYDSFIIFRQKSIEFKEIEDTILWLINKVMDCLRERKD